MGAGTAAPPHPVNLPPAISGVFPLCPAMGRPEIGPLWANLEPVFPASGPNKGDIPESGRFTRQGPRRADGPPLGVNRQPVLVRAPLGQECQSPARGCRSPLCLCPGRFLRCAPPCPLVPWAFKASTYIHSSCSVVLNLDIADSPRQMGRSIRRIHERLSADHHAPAHRNAEWIIHTGLFLDSRPAES